MTWFAQAANETEAAREHRVLIIAVAFAFPSATLRFWSGIGELTFSANTYTGAGQLGRISTPAENVRLVAERKSFQLTGVDVSLVSESEIENSYGRDVTEYVGFLDEKTRTLVATPEVNWEGRIDKIRRVDGKEPLIEVTAVHRLSRLDESDGWRYTHEHQQVFFAGDTGLREVPSVEVTEILWGGFRVFPGTGRGGGTGGASRGRPRLVR